METMLELYRIFIKRHIWPILVIFLFLVSSYIIINSDYNHVHADAGAFARHAKVFYETNKITITDAFAPSKIGQLLFSDLFCHIFGFNLKVLHISVYIADFMILIAMYLLLFELGINRFLALFGSLAILVNPISLKMIDWYMTEPFFLAYLIFSILFIIKGLQTDKSKYLYIGSLFCIFAVLTRQHAVSVPISLILLCIIYRKKLKKGVLYHSLISSVFPVIAIGLFYLYLFWNKRFHAAMPSTSANFNIIKRFINPAHLLSRLYFDSLFTLHYTGLYLAPLFILLFLSLLIKPERIKKLKSKFSTTIIALLFVSSGTIFLYAKNNTLMPYIPSIFGVGYLTNIFHLSIFTRDTASYLLTVFTWITAIITLIKILEYFSSADLNQNNLSKKKKGGPKKGLKQQYYEPNLGKRFIFFWGITYILVTILIGMRYDRYILPVSVFMIYLVLSNFSWIGENKKAFVVVFLLFFSVFIFYVASNRLSMDLTWEASDYLLQQGIKSHEINAGLGFGFFYNFDYINDRYKNINIRRPTNWHKFHPMATFFIKSDAHLENRYPDGLTLYKSFVKKRWFGFLEKKIYIYKRKEGYLNPIWLS